MSNFRELFDFAVLIRDAIEFILGIAGTLLALGSFSWYKRRIHHGVTGKKCRKDGLYYAQHDPSCYIVMEKGEVFPPYDQGPFPLFDKTPGRSQKAVWIYMPPPPR